MKNWIGIAVVVSLLPFSAAFGQAVTHDRHAAVTEWSPWSMSGSEIQATGSVRLSELFRMMPALETWSSDRYTHRILGLGLGGLHPAPVDILLDGVSIPSFLIDRVLTESLPVSPGDLTALSYHPGLRMAGPARSTDGTIALETSMRTGWHASGALAVINETGDPGPARHTDALANNVDRSGPATWLRTGWGNGTWLIQTGVNTDLHHLTDERISGRVRGTYSEIVQPVITQFAPFAQIRRSGERLRLHLLAGQSRRKDFIYHEAAGREWPARLRRTWAAGALERDTGMLGLSLRGDASRNSLSNRPSFIELPAPLAVEEASLEGALDMSWSLVSLKFSAGARAWQISQEGLEYVQLIPTASVSVSHAGSAWSSRIAIHGAQLADTSWQSSDYSWHASASISHRGSNGQLSLELAGTQGHFPEPGNLLTWSKPGIELGDWIPGNESIGAESTPQTLELGMTAKRVLSGSWHGWAQAHIRTFNGHVMPDRTINQRFGIGPLLPEWRWSSDHAGWLFSRAIGLERLEDERIAWRAFFQFYHVSSQGDDVYFRHQTGFPRHRFQLMASDKRPGGVLWMTRLGYSSSWTWPEYREPARRVIPADITAEATIGKSLFSGYADALISLLNIPNRALGNHPAGVEEQLAIRLTLSITPVSRIHTP